MDKKLEKLLKDKGEQLKPLIEAEIGKKVSMNL